MPFVKLNCKTKKIAYENLKGPLEINQLPGSYPVLNW